MDLLQLFVNFQFLKNQSRQDVRKKLRDVVKELMILVVKLKKIIYVAKEQVT